MGAAPTYGVGPGIRDNLPGDAVLDTVLVGPAIVATDKFARNIIDAMCDHLVLVKVHD